MFVDASALVAIIAEEPDGAALSERLRGAANSYTSSVAIYEAALGLARIRETTATAASKLLNLLLEEIGTKMIAINGEIGRGAIEAFERFGRGKHPAELNMGDCFAYACARSLGVPLLFKGNDFSRTDIAPA